MCAIPKSEIQNPGWLNENLILPISGCLDLYTFLQRLSHFLEPVLSQNPLSSKCLLQPLSSQDSLNSTCFFPVIPIYVASEFPKVCTFLPSHSSFQSGFRKFYTLLHRHSCFFLVSFSLALLVSLKTNSSHTSTGCTVFFYKSLPFL